VQEQEQEQDWNRLWQFRDQVPSPSQRVMRWNNVVVPTTPDPQTATISEAKSPISPAVKIESSRGLARSYFRKMVLGSAKSAS